MYLYMLGGRYARGFNVFVANVLLATITVALLATDSSDSDI